MHQNSEKLTAYLHLVDKMTDQTHLIRDGINSLGVQLAIILAEEAGLTPAEVLCALQVGDSLGLPMEQRPERQSEVPDLAYWRSYAEAVHQEVEDYWAERN